MIIKQISVFVENKAGRLAEITTLLADKAEKMLKEHGYTVALTKVLAIGIHDQPGGLAAPMKTLFEHHISVEYMYAFISKSVDTAYVILRVEDNERAAQVLQESGVKLVSEDEVYGM